jgi:hypothetical protein
VAGPFSGAVLGVFVFGLLHITRVPVGSEEKLDASYEEAPAQNNFSPYGALGGDQPFGGKSWGLGYGTSLGEENGNSSYL